MLWKQQEYMFKNILGFTCQQLCIRFLSIAIGLYPQRYYPSANYLKMLMRFAIKILEDTEKAIHKNLQD